MDTNSLKERIYNSLKSLKDIDDNLILNGNSSPNDIIIDNDYINIVLNIKNKSAQNYNKIQDICKKKILKITNEKKVNIILTSENNKKNRKETNNIANISPPGVKDIIVIASGKGGVGKSTITKNLAVSLNKKGYKIGVLDADIYGPSQPRMFGINNQKPNLNEKGKVETINKNGIMCMSIGLLINELRPVVWRGPMIHGALEQLIKDVNWGDLDILLVDMPPGTGDVQLTLSQKLKISGAIIVSTPQDIALIDATKGLNMFKKVNVPIIGIIENMSFYLCPNCNDKQEIFGHGGAKLKANELDVPFLGEIPLNIEIRIKSDTGEDFANEYFYKITEKVSKFIQNN